MSSFPPTGPGTRSLRAGANNPPPPAPTPGVPANSLSPQAAAMLTAMLTDTTVAYNLPDLIKRLRHYFGVTTTLADRWVQLNPNQAARVAGANAQRLFMNIQVASGMTVYEGQASSVGATVLPVGPNPGYQYPQSGGWSYGPEFTGELWLVSATSGIVTIKEGSSDVAYP